jgi:hypothetical protein
LGAGRQRGDDEGKGDEAQHGFYGDAGKMKPVT